MWILGHIKQHTYIFIVIVKCECETSSVKIARTIAKVNEFFHEYGKR